MRYKSTLKSHQFKNFDIHTFSLASSLGLNSTSSYKSSAALYSKSQNPEAITSFRRTLAPCFCATPPMHLIPVDAAIPRRRAFTALYSHLLVSSSLISVSQFCSPVLHLDFSMTSLLHRTSFSQSKAQTDLCQLRPERRATTAH
jgi:hypothetical protein